MADGRQSKQLMMSPRDVSRFLDLPKELRLSIYELAFEPTKGRNMFVQLFAQVYNATCAADQDRMRRLPAHGLLTTNKLIYNEAIDVFHQHTKVEVRCHVDTDFVRAMKLVKKLENVIVENGSAFPTRNGGCGHIRANGKTGILAAEAESSDEEGDSAEYDDALGEED